jgi:hypothetical protein
MTVWPCFSRVSESGGCRLVTLLIHSTCHASNMSVTKIHQAEMLDTQ